MKKNNRLKFRLSSLIISAFLLQSVAFADTCMIDGKIHGKSENISGINVLNLYGSYQQMGYCYGKLEQQSFRQFYQTISQQIHFQSKFDRFILMLSKVTLPKREKELLTGMAEGSGLSYATVAEINFSTDLLFLSKHTKKTGGIGCSVIMASGDKTDNGTTLIGRNYDMPTGFFNTYKPYTAIITYHPQNELHGDKQTDHAVTVVGYVGMISGISAMNDQGIFNEINSGLYTFPFPRINILAPPDPMLQNFDALLSANTLQELDHYYSTHLVPVAVLVGVADKNIGYHIERSPIQHGRLLQLDENNVVHTDVSTNRYDIFTNTFTLKWLGAQYHFSLARDAASQPFLRLQNLQRWAREHHQVNVVDLQKMMTTSITAGGVFQDENKQPVPVDSTAYSIVVSPAIKTIWIYVAGLTQNWVKVPSQF